MKRFKKNSALAVIISILFLSAIIKTYAVPSTYFTAGQTLDPVVDDITCAPGVCSVYPISIGDPVGTGDDNSVLFIDTNGDIAEDSANFYYSDTTDILNVDEINLPTTSSTEGVIYSNSSRFIHAYGTDNVFIGRVAGNFSLTTGSAVRNVAIGSLAVDALTTGDDNIGIGYQALTSNTIGVDNVAIGVNSLINSSSGDANVGIGRLALQRNVSGDYNTAVGTSAFQVMGSGNYNTGIGYQALYGTTDIVAEYNTAVGAGAGASVSTGSRNTFLGAYTDLISATPTLSDSIALGYLTQIRASNQFVVGSETSAITDAYIGEGVISITPSDVTINATGGSGTDIAGADLTFASGKGTGSAVGGDLIFSTADVGATGTTLQSLTEKMRLTYNGLLGVGTSTPLLRLDVAGSGRLTGTATSVLTGSIDATASTTVTGVGTLFTTELVVGDRITVSGESRTVTDIASATSLTVDRAFTDTANDTTPDKLPAVLVNRLSDNTVAMVQNNFGNFGLGTSSPDFELEIVSGTQNVEVVSSGYNGRKPVFAGRSANGTEALPTPSAANDILAEFAGQGYGATGFAPSTTAGIRVIAEETFDDSGYGSQLLFRTTPNNSTTLTSRMIIMADGNVGIGDTSPSALFTVGSGDLFQVNSSGAIAAATGVVSSGTITFSGLSTGVVINSGGTLSSSSQLAANRGGTAINTASSTGVPVITAGTWSVPTTFVYDTSGNMLGIGDATPDFKLDVETDAASSSAAAFFNDGNSTNRAGVIIAAGVDDHTAASTSTLIAFRDGDATAVGSITFGSSATAYNTTSDERLKDNIVNTELTVEDLMAIQVRDFTWRADKDSKITHGFIAQELYDVYPGAVTLPAEDGGYWMVDYSKLMPITIKAIQDVNMKVTNLSELYSENESTLGARLVAWFADSANGIQTIFANVIHTNKVETNELCVGEVCVTEEQFLEIVGSQNNSQDPVNEEVNIPNEEGDSMPPAETVDENIPPEEEQLPQEEPEQIPQEEISPDVPITDSDVPIDNI